jgi:hypothetical protein
MGTIETLVNVYSLDYSQYLYTYNATFNGTNTQVCFKSGILNVSNYSIDYTFKYYAPGYSYKYMNGQNVSLSNSSFYNIYLYPINSSNSNEQDCQLIYRDRYYVPQANVILSLQRQYIPINSFIEVESPLTDPAGEALLHFSKLNAVYTVIAKQYGQILATFDNVRLTTSSSTCEIPLNAISSTNALQTISDYYNLAGGFALNKTGKTVSFLFTTLDNTPSTINWVVSLSNVYSNNTICTNTVYTSSGTLTCTVPTQYVNTTIFATAYVNGEKYDTVAFNFGPDSSQVFGGVRVILMMLMFTTLTLLFISNPITVPIGAMLGMFFGGILLAIDGLNVFNIGSMILWFILAGAIIIWKINSTVKT